MHRVHSNHEQCWELIPWVVNGRASDADQREVLAHVETCTECHDELQRHRQIYIQMRGNDEVIAAPSASWQKLLAQLDRQPAAEVAKPARIKRIWLVAALWLQLVAIAGLTGALFRSAAAPQPQYQTLSSPQPVDHRAAVRVVFAPNAQLESINQLLRDVECNIVAGPSEAGVYTVATKDGNDLRRIIASLRQHPEVLFAEPSPTAVGTIR
ncbi:zf-HC2 domain-containing protein [Steroidobacter sp. S1-65]|uniref:Zf-HC2 domain-containing protein n=1 Tax=Steroidobacter gossypii TaxID=2805490 RepID=A0ABS1WUM0_9GAMM|nr:zf-HC2 domain-containing protein [Steroidobacter gossypii]MBM0104671.1 zf-HC2 domain-containing protein [Steroidobacter gossypii]